MKLPPNHTIEPTATSVALAVSSSLRSSAAAHGASMEAAGMLGILARVFVEDGENSNVK